MTCELLIGLWAREIFNVLNGRPSKVSNLREAVGVLKDSHGIHKKIRRLHCPISLK